MRVGGLLWWLGHFTIVYSNAILCASSHPHSYTTHFIISLSHRDQDKAPSYTKVHMGRMNNGYVACTPTELQLCQMEIYSTPINTYLALCWCCRSFMCSVCLSLLWVRPIGWHSYKVRFAQPRGLCGRVRLMRLDKPSTLTWGRGERWLGLMCNTLDAAGLRLLQLWHVLG